jgi:hypothetical protein
MDKKTLDEIFDDDEFGLLDSKQKSSNIKTEEDRLIDAFEEINIFIDKNNREPSTSSMSEYGLFAKLRNFRENEQDKTILKPYDRHNLLGYVELEDITLDDIFEDDDLGLLQTNDDLDIFKYKNIPKSGDITKADFVAKRKSMNDKDFEQYDKMFQKVYQDIKEGKRKLIKFENEQEISEGEFFILKGVMVYVAHKGKLERKNGKLNTRLKCIYANGTQSNILMRTLSRELYRDGKRITKCESRYENLFIEANLVKEDDIQTGWIYVLKSKSKNPIISNIENLYKIGFTGTSVDERIKNAKNEVTYLYADVEILATYKVANVNAYKLESLIHRFFAKTCLNIDIYDTKGQRITPREWFVVPLEVINEAIDLIKYGTITNYEYDDRSKKILIK